MLIRKPRSYGEIYNDIDSHVVNVFRVLRDPQTADELEQLLRLTPFARDEFVLAREPSLDPVEDARRTIVLSFMAYSSDGINSGHHTGFRPDSKRSGTTPAHDWMHWHDQIARFTERLQGVVIENRDWRVLIPQHDSPETLFYVDPPYVQSTRTGTGKYRLENTEDDHRDLAAMLRGVQGMVILSGYKSEMYADLYPGWRVSTHKARSAGRMSRIECLWISPSAAHQTCFADQL